MNITGFKKYLSKYNIEVLNYKRDNSRDYSGHLRFELNFSELISCDKDKPNQFFNNSYCWYDNENNIIRCATSDFEDFIERHFRDLPQELIDINRKLDALNEARVECIELMKKHNIKEKNNGK